jgi:hypothetical protein
MFSATHRALVDYSRDNMLTLMVSSLDYLFQLAVEMKKLGLPWITQIEPVVPTRTE